MTTKEDRTFNPDRHRAVWYCTVSLLLALWLLSFSVQDGKAEPQKNFLWRIQSNRTVVYVLGSIHFGRQEIYPLNPVIEKAFSASRILAVEANVQDLSKLDVGNLLKKSFYESGDSLDKHISRDVYEQVQKGFERFGLPPDMVKNLKPWFLALNFQALELARLGFDPNYGIDVHFLSQAAKDKKGIVEIESLDGQINLLSGFSDSDQELLLLYTLKSLAIIGRQMKEIERAWATGDAKSIESILVRSIREEPRLASIMTKLIDDRNGTMASKIEGYLKTSDTYFVVVGAGHLVGDKGIINILRRKGYLVQQL
jgi:uncharacterized protein YbaP (TraB family)